MKDKEIEPNAITYNCLVDLFVKLDDMERAKNIFNTHLSIEDKIKENKLDVHGFSQGAAFTALCIYIESHWNKVKPFSIITGKGLHSKTQKLYEMQNFIKKMIFLKLPSLIWQVNRSNTGELIISQNPDNSNLNKEYAPKEQLPNPSNV